MAIYNGFFDAVFNEEDGTFDREYDSGDFTEYFGAVLGSGVCVYENPDSMKVYFEESAAHISPGYLFLQGYWLKNTEIYDITLPDSGEYAILAHLDMGRRMIDLTAQVKADTYPDSLVLAVINIGTSAVTDTRSDPILCGLVDTAGSTASKAAYAVNYIDNEIEDRLDQAEAAIAAQSAELDAKIEEVGEEVDKISPPPIGTIKFSASQNVGPEWLNCDGSFINEADYPELVEALGKLIPSGDKFQLISQGEIPQQISNGALYAGRMWVYSYSSGKLYGIDVEGELPIKEVALTSEDSHFTNFVAPTVTRPICLSITKHPNNSGAKLFLSQIIKEGSLTADTATISTMLEYCLLFQSEFTGEEENISMSLPPFNTINPYIDYLDKKKFPGFDSLVAIPYVVSFLENGIEKFYFLCGYSQSYLSPIFWKEDESSAADFDEIMLNHTSEGSVGVRTGYTKKSLNEMVTACTSKDMYAQISYNVNSYPNRQFSYSGTSNMSVNQFNFRQSICPMNIIGENYVLTGFDKNLFPVLSLKKVEVRSVVPGLNLPSAARVFVDGAAYLWGKDIFLIFVGTGIIFTRDFSAGSFGYLDTTSVLGTITQFGYLDYSQDEGILYILGQDTTNKVKLGKIVLNTLYDYANDGAWLPMIASDGVPAYIKAKEETEA